MAGLLCGWLLLLALASQTRASSRQIDFLYFNPDSVQANFSLLTREVSHFFANAGYTSQFQAFSQQADFDRLLQSSKPSLVLVPSWYYQQYGRKNGLIPLLVPLNDNKDSYTKVLLTRSTPNAGDFLSGKMVAATSMGQDTGEQLRNFFSNGHTYDFSKSNIVITPKDADALYALALGQVDIAVVGRNTLREVALVNKNILTGVQELVASKPVPMPLLCTVDGALDATELANVQRLLLESTHGAPPPSFMIMLQFSGWQNAQL